MDWTLNFPDLESYKMAWLNDSAAFEKINFAIDPRKQLYAISKLEKIEIKKDIALVHKVFNGDIPIVDAESLPFRWRSLFLMQKAGGRWRIAGFCGYINLTKH
jgi:hypothetical protein